MSTSPQNGPPLLARLWPLRVLIGVVTLVVGALVLGWPTRTLMIIAILFGVELVILGLVRIAAAVAVPMGKGLRMLGLIMGILTIIAGVFCFLRPGASLFVLAIFFAAGFVADGIADIARVKTAGPSGRAKTTIVLSGVISILAGLAVAIFPGASLILLVQVSGIVLIVVGVVQIVAGLGARPSKDASTPTASAA